MRLRTVCWAIIRLSFHGSEDGKRSDVVLSNPSLRGPQPFRAIPRREVSDVKLGRSTPQPESIPLESFSVARRWHRRWLRRRFEHDLWRRRSKITPRTRRSRFHMQHFDEGSRLLQQRWRLSNRPTAGSPRHRHGVWETFRRAKWNLRNSARNEILGQRCWANSRLHFGSFRRTFQAARPRPNWVGKV